ncbi:hypothetical protein D3C72_868700 [compost metagenome]
MNNDNSGKSLPSENDIRPVIIEILSNFPDGLTKQETVDLVATRMNISHDLMSVTYSKSGRRIFETKVAYARADLVRQGQMDNSESGIWLLKKRDFDKFDANQIRDERRRLLANRVIRPEQTRFRQDLIDAYGACVITNCQVLHVLDAAHIMPHMGAATDMHQNGLLLRIDLHRLFDEFLISIDPNTLRVKVSSQITDLQYRKLEGREIRIVNSGYIGPDKQALLNHYRGFLE